MATTKSKITATITHNRHMTGSRITNLPVRARAQAIPANRKSGSSGRLNRFGRWRPDQLNPIGAASGAPTPIEHLASHAPDCKQCGTAVEQPR